MSTVNMPVTGTDSKSLAVNIVETVPIAGQKPGTSGLRKKTKIFMEGNYLHNFIQSIFNVLPPAELVGSSIVVSGDGRFWVPEALQIITKIAAANGVGRVIIGKDGLLSTPAVSAIIRERDGGIIYGGIILTASHNPGGINEDFGVKYNAKNGGPAPESMTNAMYKATTEIREIRICSNLPDIDISSIGSTTFSDGDRTFVVDVIDPVSDLENILKTQFDFDSIRKLISRPDFSIAYDGLSGVAGPYAKRILGEVLGVDSSQLHNCTPLPDFGGSHPDPNLTYAHDLVKRMGLSSSGAPLENVDVNAIPDFGAAQDGDADRNMILGKQFFVTPSDSLAIIAANQAAIPAFAREGGLRCVARSMPTSGAVDVVARKLGIPLFEVPTGWKYFGNLMDSASLGKENYNPFLCGEESFGTGSHHIREKDGMWAVLAWLSILAYHNGCTPSGYNGNSNPSVKLVSVQEIVESHWKHFGRNFYTRYDYEGVDSTAADTLMDSLRALTTSLKPGEPISHGYILQLADEFSYTDPVDGSISTHQGLRFLFTDGSRVVYRLSGTGSIGATVRVYIEKYEVDPNKIFRPAHEALSNLVDIAINQIGKIAQFLGRPGPTVIT